MKPSPEVIHELDVKAYRELCCYLEHAADSQLLCDHTAVLLFRIRDAQLRNDGLSALRSQLYSRKLAGGRAESWFIDCEERIRRDMQGFLQAAEEQFVRAGLDAEAAQLEADRARRQKAKPRILPASAFAPEETDYLIAPYLPRGMLSILGGVSAAGKTSLALDIASAVSAGREVGFGPSQSKPDGFASSPEGGAFGTPVLDVPDEQSLLKPETSGLRDRGQLQLPMRTGPGCAGAVRRQRADLPATPVAPPLGELSPKATERATVFYLTAENDPNKVLRPRCEAMGADLDHLYFQNGASLSMADPELFRLCRAYRPALLVLDPIQSFLGPGVQMNRAEQVRPLMDNLIALAKELDMAVLLISHMSKPGPGVSSALDRLLGSSDFRNSARSILIAGADPDASGDRVFAHAKNSIGLPGPSQRYRIGPDGTVSYHGPCELSADRILQASAAARPPQPRPAPALSEAADALDELLGFVGWADYARVEQLCARRGFSDRTMRRAKAALGVRVMRLGMPPNQQLYWYRNDLPEDAVKADILNQNEQLTV